MQAVIQDFHSKAKQKVICMPFLVMQKCNE